MANYCSSCKWWDYTYEGGMDKYGTCTNEIVPDQVRLVDTEDLDEPVLITAATFGCVHHQRDAKESYQAVTAINVTKNK